ncbi:MAG TPA: alpha/beta hydrolase [Candidatus Agrococcus pullicola]|uniref:Alpha/beta hydrolase n=1 Tax=Candidatus Agrococcus pullicola TaxID=2838429 RepID=A0A9D2C8M6_9MICO|nr:alpha/beta hydrolase [Candidatus Agrococcus pullicola]
MFDPVRNLCRRHFVCPDHRGQGSRSTDTGPLHLERLAEDVIELIEDLDRPVHLVGSSMGAYVAMIVAAECPDLVRTTVWSAATADRESRPELFASFADRFRAAQGDERGRLVAELMFGQEFLNSGAPLFKHWTAKFSRHTTDVLASADAVFARTDLWRHVERVRCPVRLMSGRHDVAKSTADMQRIADAIDTEPPIEFPRSGHTPFVEEPHRMAQALKEFWSKYE